MGEMDRVFFKDSGEPVTRRQRAAILATEDEKGVPEFFMYQGSWQNETDYSGTTHTNAGVCDVGFVGIGDNDRTRFVVRKLREVGKQAAFLRGPKAEFGNYSVWHIHMCDLDTRNMDPNAQWQVGEFKQGNDGLVGGRNDPLPWRPDNFRPFNFDAWKKAMELQHKVHLLTDRVEHHQDTIESLRKERDNAKDHLRRLVNQKIS